MNAVAVVFVTTAGEVLLSVCGETLLSRAVRGLLRAETVQHVVVTSPPDGRAAVHSELAQFGDSVHVLTVDCDDAVAVDRSLTEVIQAVPETDVVLVQDPTRAFTPVSLIGDVARAVEQGAAAAVPVLPVTDTIKRVDSAANVRATVDRSLLRVVQGPHAYAADVFFDLYHDFSRTAGGQGGAVAEWIDRMDKPVATVPGHPHARKIQTRFDLAVARAIVAAEQATGADR